MLRIIGVFFSWAHCYLAKRYRRRTRNALVCHQQPNRSCSAPCCTQKNVRSGSGACTMVHAVHSMNSKRREEVAWPTTVARPKLCGVISCQQRLQTGGLACNRMPPAGAAGWYAISPTWLIGIGFLQEVNTRSTGGKPTVTTDCHACLVYHKECSGGHWTVS